MDTHPPPDSVWDHNYLILFPPKLLLPWVLKTHRAGPTLAPSQDLDCPSVPLAPTRSNHCPGPGTHTPTAPEHVPFFRPAVPLLSSAMQTLGGHCTSLPPVPTPTTCGLNTCCSLCQRCVPHLLPTPAGPRLHFHPLFRIRGPGAPKPLLSPPRPPPCSPRLLWKHLL